MLVQLQVAQYKCHNVENALLSGGAIVPPKTALRSKKIGREEKGCLPMTGLIIHQVGCWQAHLGYLPSDARMRSRRGVTAHQITNDSTPRTR